VGREFKGIGEWIISAETEFSCGETNSGIGNFLPDFGLHQKSAKTSSVLVSIQTFLLLNTSPTVDYRASLIELLSPPRPFGTLQTRHRQTSRQDNFTVVCTRRWWIQVRRNIALSPLPGWWQQTVKLPQVHLAQVWPALLFSLKGFLIVIVNDRHVTPSSVDGFDSISAGMTSGKRIISLI